MAKYEVLNSIFMPVNLCPDGQRRQRLLKKGQVVELNNSFDRWIKEDKPEFFKEVKMKKADVKIKDKK